MKNAATKAERKEASDQLVSMVEHLRQRTSELSVIAEHRLEVMRRMTVLTHEGKKPPNA